jgi:hemolysin activation/secretion protein
VVVVLMQAGQFRVWGRDWKLRLIALGTALSVQSAALAQTAPTSSQPAIPRPVQDPGQLLIDQQRAQARRRQLEEAPAAIAIPSSEAQTALDVPPDTPIDQIAEAGSTFLVRTIVLADAHGQPLGRHSPVPQATLEAIIAPFSGRHLGSHRINVLLKRLTDAFVAARYVTTRALLGHQNIESGTLTITIQIGRIAEYTVNGQPVHRLAKDESSAGGGLFTDAGYVNAFPAGPGDPLTLSDLDQGVAQINRLRRNQAEVQILPGQSLGDSVIAINNPSGDRLYYNLGVDNYGNEATGVTRYRAGVEADNLLGLQEAMSLNYIGSLESNALVGSVAVPYGRNTFSYTLSDSDYQQLVGTTAVEYGRTLSHIFGWNYQLERTPSDLVSADATFTWQRTDRLVNDIDLDPQRIAVLRVGANWLHKFVVNSEPGNLTLDAGVSEGLPWFEADHDATGITRDDAHSQFTKLDATAAFTVPLPKLGSAGFAWRGVLGGQYTNVALFGTQQLFLGGTDTVRGFRSGVIAGDRGIYSKNEIAWVNAPAWKDSRIEPYVFFDAGKASLIAVPGFPTLAGVGAGVRAQLQWHGQLLSAEATVGRQLAEPALVGPKSTLVLATLNWNY